MQVENIIITRRDGSIEPLVSYLANTVITTAEQRKALLGEDVIVIEVVSATERGFGIGDKMEFGGEVYKINQLPTLTKLQERRFKYTLIFEGVQYDLIRAIYFNDDVSHFNTSSEFNLIGDMKMFLDLIINNAERVFGSGSWVLGGYPLGTETKNLSFSKENSLEVLQKLCEEYNQQFSIQRYAGYNILSVSNIGDLVDLTFEFGKGKGLYEITRTKVDNSNLVNYLYAYGSEKNLKSDYKNYSNRLVLGDGITPSAIFDADSIAAYDKFEGIITFDDIFPNRTGSITGINANKNIFVDSTFDFDINATSGGTTTYLIAGNAAKIHFNTGNLAGYEFELASYNHSTKTFTLKPYKDERSMVFPSPTESAFQMQVGDEYVILDIMLPSSYVDAAEDLLLAKATEYLDANKNPLVQYELTISEDFLEKKADDFNVFKLSDSVRIIDNDMLIDDYIKIIGFTRSVLRPYKYKLSISDLPDTSSILSLVRETKTLKALARLNKLEDANKAKQNWKTDSQINTDFSNALADLDVWYVDGNDMTVKQTIGGKTGNFDFGILRNGVEKVTVKSTLVEFADAIKATNPALATALTKVLVDDSGTLKTRTLAQLISDTAAWINGGIILAAKGFLGSSSGAYDIGIVRANSEKITIKAAQVEVLTELKAVNPAMATTPTKIVIDDGGVFKTRTPAQILTDIGAGSGSSGSPVVGGAIVPTKIVAASKSVEALTGMPVVGGASLKPDDLVLLMGQSTKSENGIWQVGSSWQGRTFSSSGLAGLSFSNGLFFAMPSAYTAGFVSSPDGINWTGRTVPYTGFWLDVNYGAGVWVIVGSSFPSCIATSTDAITWTPRTHPTAAAYNSIAFGAGLFVTVTASAVTNRIATSPDGITWTDRMAVENSPWADIIFAGGQFVAVTESAVTYTVMTSPDGITWTGRTAPELTGYQEITYGNGLYVLVGYSGSNRIMTSPDGITWTVRTAPALNNWGGLAFGNGLFVAVSSTGTTRSMTSVDGITWVLKAASAANPWDGCAFGNNIFVSTCATGTNKIQTLDGAWIRPAAHDSDAELRGKYYQITKGDFKDLLFKNSNTSTIAVNTTDITYIDYLNAAAYNLAAALVDSNGDLRVLNYTSTEKAALVSPQKGKVVFDTTINKLCVYTGSAWETITST